MDDFVVEIKDLNLSYNKLIFEGLNVSFKSGFHTGIRGESGLGKTSLLNIIMGIERGFTGEISTFGLEYNFENMSLIRSRIAYLPQTISSISNLSVFETILRPFEYKVNKKLKPNILAIKNMFERLELSYELLEADFNNLSGGEKQKISFIIALLLKRDLMILDEPTSANDQNSIDNIIKEIKLLGNKSIISVSHNDYFLSCCDVVYELKNKQIIEVK